MAVRYQSLGYVRLGYVRLVYVKLWGGAFDSAKNHKHRRHKRQSVTAKREKSQKPKFV